jgi:hypothetical protein
MQSKFLRKSSLVSAAVAAALLTCMSPTQARVTRIVIDQVLNQPAIGGAQTVAYQTLNGRAFGELDVNDAHNTIITDITNPQVPTTVNASGKTVVQYVASFSIVKPVDNNNISGILWHDVPNRGGRLVINVAERGLGDVGLSSGWQGDNAGATAVPSNASSTSPVTPTANNEWVKTPIAVGTTGTTLGRIVNRSGSASQPLNVGNNPIPYLPANLSTTTATLTTHTHEAIDGSSITIGSVIPSTDWAFAHCDATHPFPGTPQDLNPANLPGTLPVHICLKNGYDPTLLYQVVYQVVNPYVLGAGTAAFRDVGSFFRYSAADDFGTANPIAGKISKAVIRGVSQSGNFTRHYIFLGMNQDEANRIVHDGAWPIIAGRRVSNNSRWGQPDGVLELYQMGSEGPQWWTPWPDTVRSLPPGSILDRCNATTPNTCPKIIEHFGGSEVFALKMTTEWVGTSADADIPLPSNVRRYYVPSTTHGGGGGGFNENITGNGASCPGNNWGTGTFKANPVSETELTNVLRLAMRNWITTGASPPPSRYPTLAGGTLVDPTQAAMGFPSGVPGVPASIFLAANFVNPVFNYDWGPNFDEFNATGFATILPPNLNLPPIKMKVPKVDADGNELGGVPTVLRDAPLGTYLGWNITSSGFHAGQVCNYVGGMIPFAHTAAERLANGDPRPSLQERYGSHNAYVLAVSSAAKAAFAQGYLLQSDMINFVVQARASNVCTHGASGQSCDPAAP